MVLVARFSFLVRAVSHLISKEHIVFLKRRSFLKMLTRKKFLLTRVFLSLIAFLLINGATAINYAFRQDDLPKNVTQANARTTRQILEAATKIKKLKKRYILQEGTEHLLQFGALFRTQILDTFGYLVYDRYDDFSISQMEALYRVYHETLERKYNIFDIVTSFFESADIRPTKVCQSINKNVHTCLKESSQLCMRIRKHNKRRLINLNYTPQIYQLAKIQHHFPDGFSLNIILKHLQNDTLKFTPSLLSGLLHNIQYDSFDDEVRTAERELILYLTKYSKISKDSILMSSEEIQNQTTVSGLLRTYLKTVSVEFKSPANFHAKILAEHVVREVEAISQNIELLGAVYENNTINLKYLFNLVLPPDVIDKDLSEAKDYLLGKIDELQVVSKYLRIEKYQQAGPDQLLMEILGQMRDIHFAVDIVSALHTHARFWHRNLAIEGLNELLDLFSSYENLRKMKEYEEMMKTIDQIKSRLWNSKNVTIEIYCSNPRACLQIGLQIVMKCEFIDEGTKNLIQKFCDKVTIKGSPAKEECHLREIQPAECDTESVEVNPEIEESPDTTEEPKTEYPPNIKDILDKQENKTTTLFDHSEPSSETPDILTSIASEETSIAETSTKLGDKTITEKMMTEPETITEPEVHTEIGINTSTILSESAELITIGNAVENSKTTESSTSECSSSEECSSECSNQDCSSKKDCSTNGCISDKSCSGEDCESEICSRENCTTREKCDVSDCSSVECSGNDCSTSEKTPIGNGVCEGKDCPDKEEERDCKGKDCPDRDGEGDCKGRDCADKEGEDDCKGQDCPDEEEGNCEGTDCPDKEEESDYKGLDCPDKEGEGDCEGTDCPGKEGEGDWKGKDCPDKEEESDCKGQDCPDKGEEGDCNGKDCPDKEVEGDCKGNDCPDRKGESDCNGENCPDKEKEDDCEGIYCPDDEEEDDCKRKVCPDKEGEGNCKGENCPDKEEGDCKGKDCLDKEGEGDCEGTDCPDGEEESDCKGLDCLDKDGEGGCEGTDCPDKEGEDDCRGKYCPDKGEESDCKGEDCPDKGEEGDCNGKDCTDKEVEGDCKGKDCPDKRGESDCKGENCPDKEKEGDCEGTDCPDGEEEDDCKRKVCPDKEGEGNCKVENCPVKEEEGDCKGKDCPDKEGEDDCEGTDCSDDEEEDDCKGKNCLDKEGEGDCEGTDCSDYEEEGDCKGKDCPDKEEKSDCEGLDCPDKEGEGDCKGKDCLDKEGEGDCEGKDCPDKEEGVCKGQDCPDEEAEGDCKGSDCSEEEKDDCRGSDCPIEESKTDCKDSNCLEEETEAPCTGPGCAKSDCKGKDCPTASEKNCSGDDCLDDSKNKTVFCDNTDPHHRRKKERLQKMRQIGLLPLVTSKYEEVDSEVSTNEDYSSSDEVKATGYNKVNLVRANANPEQKIYKRSKSGAESKEIGPQDQKDKNSKKHLSFSEEKSGEKTKAHRSQQKKHTNNHENQESRRKRMKKNHTDNSKEKVKEKTKIKIVKKNSNHSHSKEQYSKPSDQEDSPKNVSSDNLEVSKETKRIKDRKSLKKNDKEEYVEITESNKDNFGDFSSGNLKSGKKKREGVRHSKELDLATKSNEYDRVELHSSNFESDQREKQYGSSKKPDLEVTESTQVKNLSDIFSDVSNTGNKKHPSQKERTRDRNVLHKDFNSEKEPKKMEKGLTKLTKYKNGKKDILEDKVILKNDDQLKNDNLSSNEDSLKKKDLLKNPYVKHEPRNSYRRSNINFPLNVDDAPLVYQTHKPNLKTVERSYFADLLNEDDNARPENRMFADYNSGDQDKIDKNREILNPRSQKPIDQEDVLDDKDYYADIDDSSSSRLKWLSWFQ